MAWNSQYSQEKYGENKFKLRGICYYKSGNSGERGWKRRNNIGVKRVRKFCGAGYQKEEWRWEIQAENPAGILGR